MCKLYLYSPSSGLYACPLAMTDGAAKVIQGYIEDTGLPAILRDAQVLSIWEGTTNILSLDVHLSELRPRTAGLRHTHPDLPGSSLPVCEISRPHLLCSEKVCAGLSSQTTWLPGAGITRLASRDWPYSLARIYMGALLIGHASWEGASHSDIYAALR
ncbi:acyl-CoA dehydrogenase family member 11 [Oncorhynchus mykiss]|uniref:acyl-CoA dehydrogenase family member 11 n=1 Tax=Oncorhynchus mykiss TaxID=8022 RepID=UPI001878FE37|nr:acyl-CoA dehydrogenase family member 11 [Oncorhynchus mykiss]XP_036835783.1 acyl-CoA dehydrogenase family member 11 [Oncorhynchus mykiss]